MLPERVSFIEYLERTCNGYRDKIAKGEDWARVPHEITERFLSLLKRDDVTASQAAELVRHCDEHRNQGGVVFFTTCNAIREWYRDTYDRELRETLPPRSQSEVSGTG